MAWDWYTKSFKDNPQSEVFKFQQIILSFKPAYTLVKVGFNRLLIVLDNINIDIDRIYYTHLDNTPGVYRNGYRKQYLICYDSSYGLNLDYEMPF